MNPQWKAGKSEFRGIIPTPKHPVVLRELGDDGEWASTEVPGEHIDILTVSMGIYAGLLNITGMSRATFLATGILMPQYNEDPVYH